MRLIALPAMIMALVIVLSGSGWAAPQTLLVADHSSISSLAGKAAWSPTPAAAITPRPANISASPVAVSFGTVKVASVSEKTLTIVNRGSADIGITSVVIGGADSSDFSQINDCSTIPGGGSCKVTVRFGPASGGRKSATISITSNDPEQPTTAVRLSGNARCTYSLSASHQQTDVSGGTWRVDVTTSPGCSWTAAARTSWIAVTSAASGSGDGTVTYTVSPNAGARQRLGRMTIAKHSFTVTQSGTRYYSAEIGPAGGSLRVTDPNDPLFGLKIKIPPGALGSPTTIGIQLLSNPPGLPAGVQRVGDAALISNGGVSFQQPVTVTMPYDSTGLDGFVFGILRFEDLSPGWDAVSVTSMTRSSMSFRTTRFSYFQVTAVADSFQPGEGIDSGFLPDLDEFKVDNPDNWSCFGMVAFAKWYWKNRRNQLAVSLEMTTYSSYFTPQPTPGDYRVRLTVAYSDHLVRWIPSQHNAVSNATRQFVLDELPVMHLGGAGAQLISDSLKHGLSTGPQILMITYANGFGHALLVYRFVRQDDGNRFYFYNPNHRGVEAYVTIKGGVISGPPELAGVVSLLPESDLDQVSDMSSIFNQFAFTHASEAWRLVDSFNLITPTDKYASTGGRLGKDGQGLGLTAGQYADAFVDGTYTIRAVLSDGSVSEMKYSFQDDMFRDFPYLIYPAPGSLTPPGDVTAVWQAVSPMPDSYTAILGSRDGPYRCDDVSSTSCTFRNVVGPGDYSMYVSAEYGVESPQWEGMATAFAIWLSSVYWGGVSISPPYK